MLADVRCIAFRCTLYTECCFKRLKPGKRVTGRCEYMYLNTAHTCRFISKMQRVRFLFFRSAGEPTECNQEQVHPSVARQIYRGTHKSFLKTRIAVEYLLTRGYQLEVKKGVNFSVELI